MNPNQVAANRTARLVREAQTPTYTTVTPEREHLMSIEWEADTGGRFWSRPIPESKMDESLSEGSAFYAVSDIDHSPKCWCFA